MRPMCCCLSGRRLIRLTSSKVQMSISSVTSKPTRLLNVSNGFIMYVYTTYFMSLTGATQQYAQVFIYESTFHVMRCP